MGTDHANQARYPSAESGFAVFPYGVVSVSAGRQYFLPRSPFQNMVQCNSYRSTRCFPNNLGMGTLNMSPHKAPAAMEIYQNTQKKRGTPFWYEIRLKTPP